MPWVTTVRGEKVASLRGVGKLPPIFITQLLAIHTSLRKRVRRVERLLLFYISGKQGRMVCRVQMDTLKGIRSHGKWVLQVAGYVGLNSVLYSNLCLGPSTFLTRVHSASGDGSLTFLRRIPFLSWHSACGAGWQPWGWAQGSSQQIPSTRLAQR